MDQPMRVVFICTGNQCRSPFAEAYVRSRWGPEVTTASCGIMDLPPTPAATDTIIAAEELGIDLIDHLSQPIGVVDLTRMDLVLGFEQQHIAAAVVDHDAPMDKAFLVAELVGLLDPESSARTIIEKASEKRKALKRFSVPAQIEDPIGRPLDFHRRTVRQIAEDCDRIFDSLVHRGDS